MASNSGHLSVLGDRSCQTDKDKTTGSCQTDKDKTTGSCQTDKDNRFMPRSSATSRCPAYSVKL